MSPLSGSQLTGLVRATGLTNVAVSVFTALAIGSGWVSPVLAVLLVPAVFIVTGAALGVAKALGQGLRYRLLEKMGVDRVGPLRLEEGDAEKILSTLKDDVR